MDVFVCVRQGKSYNKISAHVVYFIINSPVVRRSKLLFFFNVSGEILGEERCSINCFSLYVVLSWLSLVFFLALFFLSKCI